jgi:hypothetical protein
MQPIYPQKERKALKNSDVTIVLHQESEKSESENPSNVRKNFLIDRDLYPGKIFQRDVI